VNRSDLRDLATLRIREAQTLLNASRYDGAYYLGGYAVECALKACIAKNTKEFDFPDKGLVNQAHTHNLAQLVGLAELTADLQGRMVSSSAFAVNWTTVKDWSEEARYQQHDERKARDFLRAIVDRRNGVLSWLKGHW